MQPMGVAGAAPVPGAAAPAPGLAAFGRAFSKRREGDDDLATATAFATTAVRNGFIRKVFLIVGLMLAITTGVTFAVLSSPEAKRWLMRNQWLSWVLFAGTIVLILAMACIPGVTRKHPLNLVLLFAFTAMMSGVVAIASAAYGNNAAGIAFLVTAAAVIGLTLFAMQTKYDITHWGSILLVLLVVLIVLSLIGIFVRSPIYVLVISGFAALLFSVYIVYDVQLIVGGKQGEFSVDDYVPAALSLYLDIIVEFFLFLFFLAWGRGFARRVVFADYTRPNSPPPPPTTTTTCRPPPKKIPHPTEPVHGALAHHRHRAAHVIARAREEGERKRKTWRRPRERERA
jgi:FtsH-binding integral membrane protein